MKVLKLLVAAFLIAPALAGATIVDAGNERPKVGLVLSGGGARGSAHVGVLQALEELEVPIDYIAGTSMGAIIGSMYASGYSAAEIEQILANMDWESAMIDKPRRTDRTMRAKELEGQFLIPYRIGINNGGVQLPLGLIEGQHLDQVFHEILMPVVNIDDFDLLPIPFRAVATDLVTGDEVVLSEGSLPNAVRASMSVPGAFAPVEIGERLLVDGGMANNLPISVVRQMGADIVIAVDISSPLLTREQMSSVLSVTEQITNFLTRRTTEAQIALLEPGDLLIVPELGQFSAANFNEAVEMVGKGYQAAMEQRLSLEGMVAPGTSVAIGPSPLLEGDYIVHFVELENDSVLQDEIIRSRIDVDIGQPLDLKALSTSVDQIYSLDVFKSVTYDLVENELGQTGVRVQASRRSWGPNYMQFGLELSSDFAGSSDFKIGAAYTRNAINSLGGELRVIASMGREDELSIDFYQPVDTRARWFVEPEVYWSRENYRLWAGDENIAELELAGWGAGIAVGRNFNTMNRLTLGYEFGRGEVDTIIGAPGLIENIDLEIGELELQYIHDSLNSIWFPTTGFLHKLEYLYADESLGASADYAQASANGALVFSLGKNTGLLNYELGYSFDDDAPIERWFRLGGFGRLSGLAHDQLIGRHVALATLAYYRKLNNMEIISTFAGVTLEAGNVWGLSDDISLSDLRYSGSAFLGADTPLGPVYLAAGYSDSDDFAVYFYVGNPFRVSRFD